MAYSEQVLRRAKMRLEQERQEQEYLFRRRQEEIFAKYPRLKEIERALKASTAKVVAAAFSAGKEDIHEVVAQMKAENLALQQERNWILESAEIDESELDATPICAQCGGSGYRGEVMCECLKELCRQEQKKELSSLLSGKESFDGFRLQYYPEAVDRDYGVSPRQMMEVVFERCRNYARNFGSQSGNLLFSGGTGLGKTFLSACIARTVAENGYSVVYDTAGKLFSDFETVKFGDRDENADLTKKYLSCDLLIIDDLGTEMVTQFTQTTLYQVVNARMMENRATIISTNLTPAQLEAKYMAPVVSRLLGTYELLVFLGEDIRRLRR